MFVGVGKNGLAHALLGPGVVETTLPSGVKVKVSCLTNYPFSNAFTYAITSSAPFKFNIRIPSWHIPGPSASLTITTSSSPGNPTIRSLPITPDTHSGLQALEIPAGTTSLSLNLAHVIRIEPRSNNSITVRAGPLLYALQISSYNTSSAIQSYNASFAPASVGPIPPQVRDYQIFNTSAWNVAIDPKTLSFHTAYQVGEREPELPNPLWADGAAPTWIEGRGCLIQWDMYKGGPGLVPSGEKCLGSPVRVRLIPYGGAKVHMSEFPVVDLGGG
jgi:hypothetical protein